MSGSGERNTEIWSTRLQRELLALTSDNAPNETKDAVQAVLPPFVTVQNHDLNIEKGNCVVSFLVDLPAKEGEADPPAIVVTLDTSLHKKKDGTVDPIAVAYPFMKPEATLTSGASRFPAGSSIKDGDLIDIEMDWTPSLHLTDAILNIGLKIKECIAQGEMFHPAPPSKQDPVGDMVGRAKRLGTSFSKGIRGLASTPERAEGDNKKRGLRIGRQKKKEAKSPKASSEEVRIGDEINMLEAPWVDCQGVYSCKAIRRPKFVDEAMAVAAQMTGNKPPPSGEQQVSPSDVGDGEIPSDLTEFMQAQAGGLTKVCWLSRVSAPSVTFSHISLIFFWSNRQQTQVLLVLERCSEHSLNPRKAYLRNHS
jgi:hypothetical protein